MTKPLPLPVWNRQRGTLLAARRPGCKCRWSSSDAPVMSPGPSTLMKRRMGPVSTGLSSFLGVLSWRPQFAAARAAEERTLRHPSKFHVQL